VADTVTLKEKLKVKPRRAMCSLSHCSLFQLRLQQTSKQTLKLTNPTTPLVQPHASTKCAPQRLTVKLSCAYRYPNKKGDLKKMSNEKYYLAENMRGIFLSC